MDPADAVLSGPRGRRLCLEYAMLADDELRAAVFWLAHELDPHPGTLIRFSDDSGERGPDPTFTPEQVAERIARVEASRVSDVFLREAFRMSVDHARYWQEPDGSDVAAALPVVRDALRPLARLLAEAIPGLAGTRTAEQWAVDWRDASDEASLSRDPAGTLAAWTRDQAEDEARSARERPTDPHANWSGTWWSVPTQLLTTRGRVVDALELVEDSLGWEVATIIPVRGAGETLEIRSAEDWADLCREFPMEVTASRRHDWFRVTGRDGRWLIPDWQRVAQRWDAAHLTTLGYLSAATRLIEIDAEYGSVIGGWAPDSTIWLTDVARAWSEPRQYWTRAANSGEWERSDGLD